MKHLLTILIFLYSIASCFTQNLNNLDYNLSLNGQALKNLQINIKAMKNDFSVYPNIVQPYEEMIIQLGIKYIW